MIKVAGMDKQTTVVTERGQVSIPASIRKELGLKTGQPLVWEKISDRECLVRIPRKKTKRSDIKAMIGFAARLRGEKGRSTVEWMAELREGEQ
jgi:AbrB family looped-hinge helix DNA binding protein